MIRPAEARDAQAICDIWNRVIAETTHTFTTTPKSVAGIEALIAELWALGHAAFVAEADGQIAGFATYSQFRGGNGYARTMEHSVHLLATARGRGLGRALMASVEVHALAAGAHQMIAGISGENTAGQAFHAAIGYAPVARIPQAGWKWGRYLDLVLMQKILA
jgi:L-amino acid N-acyltransferase